MQTAESDALPRGRIMHDDRIHRIGLSDTITTMSDIDAEFRRFHDISIRVVQCGKILRDTLMVRKFGMGMVETAYVHTIGITRGPPKQMRTRHYCRTHEISGVTIGRYSICVLCGLDNNDLQETIDNAIELLLNKN